MSQNEPTTKLKGFKGGLNNRKKDGQLFDSELRQADNVDIDVSGEVSRRKGYAQINAGEGHSLWSTPTEDEAYFVRGNTLNKLNDDHTSTVLRSDLQLDRPMSFAAVNNEIFYSDGVAQGRIVDGVLNHWGPDKPQGIPDAAVGTGSLDAGCYQYLVTFVDGSGRESGTSLTGQITLTGTQGIDLSNIPVGDADISMVSIYVSQANSSTLYFNKAVANGTTTATIDNQTSLIALRTQLLDLMPPGQIVRHFSGRMMAAVGPVIWYSDPFGYHLCDLKKNFIPFPAEVTMVEPTVDGFYVSADKTYFVSGTDMGKLKIAVVASYKAIAGTSTMVDGSLLGLETPVDGDVPIWLSERGVCVGLHGGAMINLTEKRVAMELTASRGAGMVREENGLAQFIGVTPSGPTSGIAAADTAVAEVIRNGIIV